MLNFENDESERLNFVADLLRAVGELSKFVYLQLLERRFARAVTLRETKPSEDLVDPRTSSTLSEGRHFPRLGIPRLGRQGAS